MTDLVQKGYEFASILVVAFVFSLIIGFLSFQRVFSPLDSVAPFYALFRDLGPDVMPVPKAVLLGSLFICALLFIILVIASAALYAIKNKLNN